MKDFVKTLQRETQRMIERIERSDQPIIKKSMDASELLAEAFEKLKDFLTGYTFGDEAEEIEFFKEIKPHIFRHLIYYRKIYNIEMSRPVASFDEQREYLCAELKCINTYTQKRLDFIRYYRSGATHLDSIYFLRGKTDITQYLETFFYEFDPHFSTNADFKVAKILANDMLSAYLMTEIDDLSRRQSRLQSFALPDVRLTWQGTKTDLYELIFALDAKGSFGNVPLTQLANYFSQVFNIQLDTNLSRVFDDLRCRNDLTPALDSLKEAFLDRAKRGKGNRKV